MVDKELAIKHMPIVIHGIKHKWKDIITQVFFSDVPKGIDNAVAFMKRLPRNAYFEVHTPPKCNGKLLVYNLFHRKDYSLNGMTLIRKADSHHLDFEGFVKYLSDDGEVLWTATRSHFNLKFIKGDCKCVYIEAEGHAIEPDTGQRGWENQEILSKDKFEFVDMKLNWKQFDLHIWPVFRRFGIDRWQEWNDWNIEREFGRVRTAGLLAKNPVLYYRYAQKCLIVKGLND